MGGEERKSISGREEKERWRSETKRGERIRDTDTDGERIEPVRATKDTSNQV